MSVRSVIELAGQPRAGILDGFSWSDCGTGGSQDILSVR
jgi:hypothetical protein